MQGKIIPVTTILRIKPLDGKENECLQWMNLVSSVASSFKGHQGFEIFKTTSGDTEFINTFRFGSEADLMAWENSEQLKSLIEEGRPCIQKVREKEMFSGLEYWFESPLSTPQAPPKYKMAVLVVFVLFTFQHTLIPFIQQALALIPLPLMIKSLLGLASVISLMTWVVMPFLTRKLAFWLYR